MTRARPGDDRAAAIVPARDEERAVGATVAALLASGRVVEVVVVDDGSRDRTAERARRAGARVLRFPHNRGKGAAVAAGVRATDTPLLLFCDADLGATAAAITGLLDPVRDGSADMAVAAPPPGAPSGFGLVESLARWGVRRIGGVRMRRPLSGQRALRRTAPGLTRPAAGFGLEVGLDVDAMRAGLRIVEVPCDFTHARTGRSVAGFAHRARQGWAIVRVLAGRASRRGEVAR